MLILDTQNGIEGWRDSRGRDILFRKQEVKGKVRGGAHACAPVFGNVPTGQMHWQALKLPRHGLFRDTASNTSLVRETLQNGFEFAQKSFLSSEDYPFDFTASETFREHNTDGDLCLEYFLRVTRSAGCVNSRFMPISLGWHPYFATHGEDFNVCINNRPQITESDRIEPAVCFDFFNQRVILETCHHTLKFEFFGIDSMYFWSADKKTHVCIEPTAYSEKARLLKPGDSTAIGARVSLLRCF